MFCAEAHNPQGHASMIQAHTWPTMCINDRRLCQRDWKRGKKQAHAPFEFGGYNEARAKLETQAPA